MDEVSIDINAPRAKVWDLIADFSNMGRWSPELVRIIWLGGAKSPAVGARFLGVNRHGLVPWATLCRVTKCDDGAAIEWDNVVGKMRWGYRLGDAAGGGTRVTEYREHIGEMPLVLRAMVRSGIIGRQREGLMRAGMQTTLERVKEAAESG